MKIRTLALASSAMFALSAGNAYAQCRTVSVIYDYGILKVPGLERRCQVPVEIPVNPQAGDRRYMGTGNSVVHCDGDGRYVLRPGQHKTCPGSGWMTCSSGETVMIRPGIVSTCHN